MSAPEPLNALAVDDERPACDELEWLLRRDPRIGTVHTAGSAAEALRVLQEEDVDVVFCDIQMPGLTGLELVQVLRRFREPPRVVFVTAHDAARRGGLRPRRRRLPAQAGARVAAGGGGAPGRGRRTDGAARTTTTPSPSSSGA